MSRISPITVILMRKNKKDDVIRITPQDDCEAESCNRCYTVTYTDKHSRCKYSFNDSWENVVAYLKQVFELLVVDESPYDGLQFNLPAYPSVVISVQKATDYQTMMPIWSMIQSVALGWPATLELPSDSAKSYSMSICSDE